MARSYGKLVEETRIVATYEKVTGPEPTGITVRLKNNVLSKSDMYRLANMVNTDSQKKRLVITIACSGLSDAQRGMKFRVNGTIVDGDGNTVDLSNYTFVLISHTYVYDESSKNPRYESRIKGVTWID